MNNFVVFLIIDIIIYNIVRYMITVQLNKHMLKPMQVYNMVILERGFGLVT